MTERQKYEKCIHDLCELLQVTSAVFQRIERRQTANTGYTSSQTFLLMTLFHSGPLSMTALCDRMDWEKSTLTRIMAVLERDGLVETKKQDYDKRLVMAELTATGRTAWTQIRDQQKELYSSIISSLPAGHVREVMDATNVLTKALDKALSDSNGE